MNNTELLYLILSLGWGLILIVGIVRIKKLLKSINEKIDKL